MKEDLVRNQNIADFDIGSKYGHQAVNHVSLLQNEYQFTFLDAFHMCV